MDASELSAYLERIRYTGPRTPDAATLRQLQLAHLLTVPFENLSIHAGEPIALDDAALFEKVVGRRRGGFCYELNGLFAALLRALGFQVTMLSAGVGRADGTFGPEFDHMALRVDLDEPWLVDVGFGDSFREPLRMEERGEQPQGGQVYRIDVEDGGWGILKYRNEEGGWSAEYRFGPEPHVYADYAERCVYHQTSPQSHFTQKPVCTLATPDGRLTLSGMRLITTRGGAREERDLADESERAAVLRSLFGVTLSPP
jgi:N-hydroxyarylamine O-acetyltransferase